MTSKIIFDDLEETFLAEGWNSFHPSVKKIDYLHLKEFLIYECDLTYLKQPLTPPQCKIFVIFAYRPQIIAFIETEQRSTIPMISRVNSIATFALIMY